MKKWGVLLGFILISCGQGPQKSSPALEVRNDREVHFEGTDQFGQFNEHQVFVDPIAEEYEKGIVQANKLANVQTILDNGNLKNRVNLVFVGDGYTVTEQTQYAIDAQNISNKFLDQEPFRNYKSYFNVHRVEVVSNQSGVDNDLVKNSSKSTALDMNFWCSGIERLLCVNVQKAKQYAANAPAVDQILAIANSAKHGGAGYWSDNVGTLAGRNPSSIETSVHEFGHTFGKLGDEYEYAGSSSKDCLAKSNGSTFSISEMLSQKKKWFRWLDLSHVGAFKGTCYSSSGYRPTANSKMRTLGLPFHEVNSEQLILAIYKKVKPIDSATEPGIYPKNRILRVTPMYPVDHELEIRWFIDGKEIPDSAQKTSLSVASLKLKSGSYKISVTVTDKTDKVRDESLRSSLMSETRSWTIN